MIRIRHIFNTLSNEPESPIRDIEFEGRTIAELAPEGAFVCLCNDQPKMIRGSKEWTETIPPDDSILVFVTADSDPITLTAATIAIVAAHVGAFTASAMVYGIAMGISTVAAGIAMSGMINSLLAPSGAALPQFGTGGSKRASPTYGFDEIQNRAENNSPRPVVYGEHLVGGNIINAWRETAGWEKVHQDLYMLIALSEGPIQAVGEYTTDQSALTGGNIPEGMTINGLDPATLKNISVSLRLGATTQTACPGFEKIVTEYIQEFKLVNSTTVLEWTSRAEVNSFMVNVIFPRGLYNFSSTGSLENKTARVRLRVYELDGSTLVANTGTIEIWARSTSPIYVTLRVGDSTPLPTGKYILRVERIDTQATATDEVDDMQVTAINEVQNIAQTYPGLAVVALKIRATEQISGSTPRVLTMIKGRKVRTSFASETETYSNNPAWLVRDALTSKRYGLGSRINDEDIDEDSFEEFAEYCDEEIPQYTGSVVDVTRATFDGIFDSPVAGWENISKIAAVARGTLVKFGDTVKVKIENQKQAVQMFGMGNIKRGSLAVSWINPSDRYNGIECQFLNAASNFIQDQVTSEIPDLDEQVDSIRRNTIQIYGVTRLSQARWLSDYYLRVEQGTFKAISFEAAIDAVALEPGDVFIFNHEMPDWSTSGRVLEVDGDGNTVIDQEMTFEAGKVYTYIERNNATDEILSQDFVYTGATSTLPFAPLHGASGATGRIYSCGEKTIVRQLFMVARIQTNTRGMFHTIEAVQYVDEIYGDAAEPIEAEAYLPEPGDPPEDVTDLAVSEALADDDYVSELTVTWTAAADANRYAIYSRPHGGGGTWGKQGETTSTSFVFETIERLGVSLDIAVATITDDGQQHVTDEAPYVIHVIEREDEFGGDALVVFPDAVENAALTLDTGTIFDLEWDAVSGASGYEARHSGWTEGQLIGATTGTTRQVYASQVEHRINIRAKRGNVWSPDNRYVTTAETQYGSYATESYRGQIDFDDAAGIFTNCEPAHWRGERALIQSNSTVPMDYTSPTIDLGSTANTHVSLEVSVLAWLWKSIAASDLWNSMGHQSFVGLLYKVYTDWQIYIESSTNGTTWSSYSMKSRILTENTVRSGRYFRVKITASALNVEFDVQGREQLRREARALFKHIKLALYR